MATKRMFSKDVVRTDRFLDMSLTTQALYFHLCLDADAKGFVTPRSIMRLINSTVDDLNTLVQKGFVIPFESGVVVVTDWKVHNYINEDREAKSQYKTELNQLTLQMEGKYVLSDRSQSTPRELTGRLDKIRLDKSRLGKGSKEGKGKGNFSYKKKETEEEKRQRLLDQAKQWEDNNG